MKQLNTQKFIFNKKLDADFLEELFEGDWGYAETVFEVFLRELPEYWKNIEEAYEGKDLAALRTSAHRCKTLFGYVGFKDIQQLYQEFENDCREKEYAREIAGPGLGNHYRALLERKEEARLIIENECGRLKNFNAERR